MLGFLAVILCLPFLLAVILAGALTYKTGPALMAGCIASTILPLVFGPDMGTCTQGDAGQLILAVLALPSWIGALLIALRTCYPRETGLTFLFFSPLVLWPLFFTLRLVWALLIHGESACGFLLSEPEWESDGKENFYALLWLGTALLLPLATALILVIRRPTTPVLAE